MKRGLIFSLVYFPRFVGGAEVALKEITDRITAHYPHEYEFDLITLRFDRDLPSMEKIGGVTVHRIGFAVSGMHTPAYLPWFLQIQKYFFPFLSCLKALKLNRQKRYDFSWALLANYAGFGALFFSWCKPHIPLLLTLQEGDPFVYIKRRLGPFFPLYKLIFKRAHVIQAISHYLAQYAKDLGAKGKIVVVPNGVDIKHFSQKYPDQKMQALRDSLSISRGQQDLVIVTTSRLVPKNALDDLIRSLVHVSEKVTLLIVGSGPDEKALKKLATEIGVDTQVRFVGFIPHKEIPLYLAISTVFVRPALSEGFGNSYVEAMAAGIPVIATPVGGIVDFLFDPVSHSPEKSTGLFCHPGNTEDIAAKIHQLLNDQVLRKKIITNAFDMVNRTYDWSHIAHRMAKEVFPSLSL